MAGEVDHGDAPRDVKLIEVDTTVEPRSIESTRKDTRAKLALRMTYAVIAMSLLSMGIVTIWPDRAPALKEIMPIIFAGLLGIYGTIIGFYFGGKK